MAPQTDNAATTQPPMVSVRKLTKRYGGVAALDDVAFEVIPGEAVALWGPNGAGKTTILRCLLGLARYDGEVRVQGVDPAGDGRTARRAIGFVPQELPVSPMTVGETTAFIARLKRVDEERAFGRLRLLGIGEQVDKPIAALSGGMRQRLALALALIGAPTLLLLDEPTANLDARGRAELLDLLRTLKHDGLTLVFSSHRPDDVLALADRVLLLEEGKLRRSARPSEFQAEVGAASRLVITLKNGHLPEALSTLGRLGYEAAGAGHVLTATIPVGAKATVLCALAREGIEIADFELER